MDADASPPLDSEQIIGGVDARRGARARAASPRRPPARPRATRHGPGFRPTSVRGELRGSGDRSGRAETPRGTAWTSLPPPSAERGLRIGSADAPPARSVRRRRDHELRRGRRGRRRESSRESVRRQQAGLRVQRHDWSLDGRADVQHLPGRDLLPRDVVSRRRPRVRVVRVPHVSERRLQRVRQRRLQLGRLRSVAHGPARGRLRHRNGGAAVAASSPSKSPLTAAQRARPRFFAVSPM